MCVCVCLPVCGRVEVGLLGGEGVVGKAEFFMIYGSGAGEDGWEQ